MLRRMENNKAAIPGAIIIAGLIIAGAIYWRGTPASPTGASGLAANDNSPTAPQADLLKKIRPVDTTDHIRGNQNAPVKIIEYSDLECPFCQVFHQTMVEVMKKYEENGQVAWVYRHWPIDSRHPKAPHEAAAAECAAKLGGEAIFWKYIDQIFTITPANNGLDPALLLKTAKTLGLDEAAFQKCLDSGETVARVTSDTNNALEAGGQGTPFSLLLAPDGSFTDLGGALPLEQLKAKIDTLLTK